MVNETIEEKKQRAIDQVLEDLNGWDVKTSKEIIKEVMLVKEGKSK